MNQTPGPVQIEGPRAVSAAVNEGVLGRSLDTARKKKKRNMARVRNFAGYRSAMDSKTVETNSPQQTPHQTHLEME